MSQITEIEVSKLLYHLSSFNKKILLKYRVEYYKIHLICELLYSTSLNIAEVACLKVDGIDFENRMITLPSKVVFFSDYISDVLSIYIKNIRGKQACGDLLFTVDNNIVFVVEKCLERICYKKNMPYIKCDDISNILPITFKKAGCNTEYIDDIFFNNGSLKIPINCLRDTYRLYNTREYK